MTLELSFNWFPHEPEICALLALIPSPRLWRSTLYFGADCALDTSAHTCARLVGLARVFRTRGVDVLRMEVGWHRCIPQEGAWGEGCERVKASPWRVRSLFPRAVKDFECYTWSEVVDLSALFDGPHAGPCPSGDCVRCEGLKEVSANGKGPLVAVETQQLDDRHAERPRKSLISFVFIL